MKYLWKSMRNGMKSNYGKIDWKIGKWEAVNGDLQLCKNGFHASESIIDAMQYMDCEMLAKVQVAGKSLTQSDKQAWEKMRIIEAWIWEKRDSIKLAVFAAELVIDIYEKNYPYDNRPRKAIKAGKEYLNSAGDAEGAAEGAAWAAGAAGDAEGAAAGAAWAAAGAARAAAWAAGAAGDAEGAARAAAWAAAGAAAWAARAAEGAARAAIIKKCDLFILSILEEKRNNEK